jgi:hypothetical protein
VVQAITFLILIREVPVSNLSPTPKLVIRKGGRGSVAMKTLCYKPEGRGFRSDEVISLNYLILPAALGPEIYLACNRNECQKHKNNNVSGE